MVRGGAVRWPDLCLPSASNQGALLVGDETGGSVPDPGEEGGPRQVFHLLFPPAPKLSTAAPPGSKVGLPPDQRREEEDDWDEGAKPQKPGYNRHEGYLPVSHHWPVRLLDHQPCFSSKLCRHYIYNNIPNIKKFYLLKKT